MVSILNKQKSSIMKSIIKTAFTVLLILTATLSFGQSKQLPHDYKEQKQIEHLKKLKAELELSEDQEIQLKAIFKDRNEQIYAKRKANAGLDKSYEAAMKQAKIELMEMRKQLNAVTNERIAEVLDEQQMEKYKAMSKERKLEKKQRHQERLMEQQHQHRKMEEGDTHQHEDGVEHSH